MPTISPSTASTSRPGKRSKPLVMTFKKPEEVVGNHIAKYQSVKLAKMLMAYDFERELNPFVELGGFLFTFIGDGAPGTGKTTLIQMIAGLVNDYCQVAGYPFAYENFGVDQISSYQGKSGQNCRQFINNVLEPARHRLRHHRRHRPGRGASAPTTAPRPASRRSPAC